MCDDATTPVCEYHWARAVVVANLSSCGLLENVDGRSKAILAGRFVARIEQMKAAGVDGEGECYGYCLLSSEKVYLEDF